MPDLLDLLFRLWDAASRNMHDELHKSLSIANSLSQYRPGESQRSRNVPDVLFEDEDSNPIEAGEENLIFVDEQGLEMTEEKAILLIESGKYYYCYLFRICTWQVMII